MLKRDNSLIIYFFTTFKAAKLNCFSTNKSLQRVFKKCDEKTKSRFVVFNDLCPFRWRIDHYFWDNLVFPFFTILFKAIKRECSCRNDYQLNYLEDK